MIDTMGQNYHGNEAGWIKYLWIKEMVHCAYDFGPKTSNDGVTEHRQFPLAEQVTGM